MAEATSDTPPVEEEPAKTIEELAEEFKAREPRPMYQQILVDMGFILGPGLLPFGILFPSLFDFIPFSSLFIFIPVTIIFIVASIISAKRYN